MATFIPIIAYNWNEAKYYTYAGWPKFIPWNENGLEHEGVPMMKCEHIEPGHAMKHHLKQCFCALPPIGRDEAIEKLFDRHGNLRKNVKKVKSFNEDFQKIGRSLRKIETLYPSNRRDVVATLRAIADEIERGTFPGVREAAVVTLGDKVDVFHLGEGDATTTHLLLACGMRKLENGVLNNC